MNVGTNKAMTIADSKQHGQANKAKLAHGAAMNTIAPAHWRSQVHMKQHADKMDWLLDSSAYLARLEQGEHPDQIVLTNGLISRTWRLTPNAATVAFDNLMTGETIIRGVKPEAVLRLDGEVVPVGGLTGQPDYAYLREEWVDGMKADPAAFSFTGYTVGATQERFPWKRTVHSGSAAWPPPGVSLALRFASDDPRFEGVLVSVHYELYDGIPLIAKWLEIRNESGEAFTLDTFASELLAVVEWDSPVETPDRWDYPNLHVESDYSFQGMAQRKANRTTRWEMDPDYITQINYDLRTPALLVSAPPVGPDARILPGESFETFRTFILVHDSTDRERKGLAQRRMYRTLAPWTQENPVFMHVQSMDPEVIRAAIDQCAEAGFELVILSFGSGLDMENDDPAYLAGLKDLADYAHAKGVGLGGYSLLASRSIGPEHDVVNPDGAYYVHSPCLGSEWGEEYFRKLRNFFEQTGFDALEHDGSYPGDLCESFSHPGHRGRDDSQWTQWSHISAFYKWCRDKGIYLNVPDWYFLNGSNKAGMGYREVNWALPRERQVMLARQNIYDGTWEKTPSMGWMFVPLTSYQGGGPDSTLEPLAEHLDTYDAHLMTNFTAGVQAIYRGFRLYDTERTKETVSFWTTFYRRYRAILESDIIHVRRPSGRDWDCMLHVNPLLRHRGLAVVYNPLDREIACEVELPLYYTGLSDAARIREGEGEYREYRLDREYRVKLDVRIPGGSCSWFVIEAPEAAAGS
ncbi:hypothetical protein [Paenibacillus methanolicus]|uniref:Alpha-galactosidase n=1 Tax=Paenibacillus methanolicus TaxID=582686 RepID=A0A5S5CMD9_9BACL|nr:hypothetical protein [Paenibacillus methanolicus]TYP79815.1 hypothetical protein BCM02_101936 [Paenibacillus methanolicus]